MRRHGHARQFLQFALVGASGTAVNLAVLYVLTERAGVFYLYSAVIAFVVAVVNNFVLNKLWTFNEPLAHAVHVKFAKFFTVSLAGLAVNLAALYLLTERLGLYYMVSQVLAIGVALVVNFAGNKLWTFQNDTSPSL